MGESLSGFNPAGADIITLMKLVLPPSFLLLIDKKPGRTSHDEVAIVKKSLRILGIDAKVGHSGTLDPKVTGLLVIGVGKATKLLQYLLESPKTYIGEIEIHKSVSRELLQTGIDHFVGEIQQLPPQRSSVKRQERTRKIYEMEILEFTERKASLRCVVERGTYIRKLFHDMGEYMGVGASMGDLHRTDVADFSIGDKRIITTDIFLTLATAHADSSFFKKRKIKKELLSKIVSPSEIVQSWPKVFVDKGVEKYIAQGSDLYVPGVFSAKSIEQGKRVAVMNGADVIALGTAQMSDHEMRVLERGVAVRTEKILLP